MQTRIHTSGFVRYHDSSHLDGPDTELRALVACSLQLGQEHRVSVMLQGEARTEPVRDATGQGQRGNRAGLKDQNRVGLKSQNRAGLNSQNRAGLKTNRAGLKS